MMQQYKFSNLGKQFNVLSQSVIDCEKRERWDKKVVQTIVGKKVVDRNWLILRQTINNCEVAGPGTRELHLKRSFMRHQGKLYVYTSSVSESAVSEASLSQDDIVEDVDRVAVIFNLLVLWRNQHDVFIN